MSLLARVGVIVGLTLVGASIAVATAPGATAVSLVIIAAAVAVGELVELRPPHRDPIPLSYAYMLVAVRSFAVLPVIVAIVVAELVAATLRPVGAVRRRVETAVVHTLAGLAGLIVFSAMGSWQLMNPTAWLLTVLAVSAIAMLVVHEGAVYLRTRHLPPVGGADLALIASGMLMAIGFRGVGGHESLGLWAVALFSVPLLAAWYSFERLAVISRTSEQTIAALSVVPELAGLASPGHAARVASLSVRVGGEVGLRRGELDDLRQAALLHHLGHLCLDAPEVRDHPVEPHEIADKSAEILRQTDLAAAGDMLATDEVSVGSQILRLVSAYDDLRDREDPSASLEALAVGPGFLYDRAVFDALERVVVSGSTG
jgi:hypothetical protein